MPSFTSQPEHANRIHRRFSSVRLRCNRADGMKLQSEESRTKLKDLQGADSQSPKEAHSEATNAKFLIAALAAVLVIDAVLIYPVVEFLMNPVFSDPRARLVVSLLFPTAIIALEMVFSILRRRAYLASLGSGNGAAVRLWTGLSLAFALVMPVGSVMTFLASDYDFNKIVTTGFIVMLAALSLAGHSVILCAGPQISDAISDTRHRSAVARLDREASTADKTYRRESQAAGEEFLDAVRDLGDYNTSFPSLRLEAGPFDVRTQRVLQDYFGYSVIQQPGGNMSSASTETVLNNPTSPTNQASIPSSQPQADGEADYLRTILEQRVRDNEREIRA